MKTLIGALALATLLISWTGFRAVGHRPVAQ
jgi:hypothetical protein